ncbi:MAG: hypothetical protein MZV65_31660 [Chromatiales bacterium]|nr:hypothetical protein [Chromatiales bacterium]
MQARHRGLAPALQRPGPILSLNPDEPLRLRRAIRDTLIAARDVLELCGIQELDVTLADDEDFQSYNAPLYRTTPVCPIWPRTSSGAPPRR